jgi:hypothetical protein
MRGSIPLLIALFIFFAGPLLVQAQGIPAPQTGPPPNIPGHQIGPPQEIPIPILTPTDPSLSGCYGPLPCDAGPSIGFPAIYVGWMGDAYAMSFGLAAGGPNLGGILSVEQKYPLNGLWLGISDLVTLDDYFGIMVSSWFFVDSGSTSGETYVSGAGVFGEKWSTETDWYYLDGAVTMSVGGNAEAIGGFRWDHLDTRFKNRRRAPGLIAPEGIADFTANAFLPYLGLQYRYVSSTSGMTVRAIGFPFVPGNFNYRETIVPGSRLLEKGDYEKGYFFEAFGEYSKAVYGSAHLGVFGKWSTIHAKSDNVNAKATSFGTEKAELRLDNHAWAIGGSVSIPIGSPLN